MDERSEYVLCRHAKDVIYMKKLNCFYDWASPRQALSVVTEMSVDVFEQQGFKPFIFENPTVSKECDNLISILHDGKMGHEKVEVYVSADGTFPGGTMPEGQKNHSWKSMTLKECMQRMKGEFGSYFHSKHEKYYIYQGHEFLLTYLPDAIDITRYIPGGNVSSKNFWLSSPGNITPIHYDMGDNLLLQLMGRKKVLVWSPNNYERLSLNPMGGLYNRQSSIDHSNCRGDAEKMLENLPVYEHYLEAGQALYIPFGWAHAVQTETLSVSVNYWWDADFMSTLMQTMQAPIPAEEKEIQIAGSIGRVRPELLGMLEGMKNDGSIQHIMDELTAG
ncbi:cupin-like domain-containing protein [Pseudoalteromonas holothuriae]|nr:MULTISPECIES: cupin-like domain-containing protein [unclassified Pseudoalteromonas]